MYTWIYGLRFVTAILTVELNENIHISDLHFLTLYYTRRCWWQGCINLNLGHKGNREFFFLVSCLNQFLTHHKGCWQRCCDICTDSGKAGRSTTAEMARRKLLSKCVQVSTTCCKEIIEASIFQKQFWEMSQNCQTY